MRNFIWDRKELTIFVCRNLEYDIANIFKDDDYIMIEEMNYASQLIKVTLYGCPHYFINSSCFAPGSLKETGEVIGKEKLDGDPFDPKYILRDAEIDYIFMNWFQDKLVDEMEINLGVTIGQMCMSSYRRKYMITDKQVTYNSKNCLKAFYGGRVEIFYKGVVKDISVSDINSSYPNVMYKHFYPDTANIEPSSIYTHEYGIGKFTVHVPDKIYIPVLPYRSKDTGRLFFPKGTFTRWWPYAEVRYAVEQGTIIITEHEGEGTNNGVKPFESFIKDNYDKRLKVKGKKDPKSKFDDFFYKYWQNNLFGKWCQHKANSVITRDKWPDKKLEKLRKNPDFEEHMLGPLYCYKVPKDKPAQTANYMWGIYITSYARIELHKGLMAVLNKKHIPLYCDTDSIPYQKKNDSIPLPISKKLGDWDKEDFDLAIFRQSKGYLMCNYVKDTNTYFIEKVACKGVPTNYAYDFIVDGMAVSMKPYRLKEALIRTHAAVNLGNEEFLKDIGENVWREVSKEMRSIYLKRSGENGKTYPVDVTDIPKIEENYKNEGEISIYKELEKLGIYINRPWIHDPFRDTKIPKGYFKGKIKEKPKEELFIPKKIHYFRRLECLKLLKKSVWFSGSVFSTRKSKRGLIYYLIFVDKFKGKKTPQNFVGAIGKHFLEGFGFNTNLFEKYIEVILNNTYVENDSLNLSINFSDSLLSGLFEAEENEEEKELTEKEIQTLKSVDWSKFDGIRIKNKSQKLRLRSNSNA